MTHRSTYQTHHSDLLLEKGGLDLRAAKDTWKKLAESEARLHLMMELGHLEVGFPDVENFCLDLEGKYRSRVTGELRDKGKKSQEWKIVKLCMSLKMIDERQVHSELETERYIMKKAIEDVLGKNTKKARNLVKKIRQEAARAKSTMMMKHEEKLKHLRRKYRKTEEEKIDKIPEILEDLQVENLSIFSKEKYDKKPTVDYEADILGDIEISNNERLILRLPPKFSVEENLPPEGLAHEEEMANAKTRMTIAKEEEEKVEDDEGIEIEEDEEFNKEMEKCDARTRQVYDPTTRTFDDRKRRATDLQECSRITLPKPLSTKHEANIEMRRSNNEKIYSKYRGEVCNKRGEVQGNLTPEEKDGLRSLQKRIKNHEIVVLKTDKSGKLCVVSMEEYIRMGEEHTGRDVKIDRREIVEKEKHLNGHVFFWSKMWGSGDSHNHRDRIIDSKVVSSEQLADLYIMYKDHKEGRKSRPVVTGCNSNTKGFSNSVSDLLESVNKANEDPYECISGEDMLSEVEQFNIESQKIRAEGQEHLKKKANCRGRESNMKNVMAGCDKLWKKKSTEARRSAMRKDKEDKEGSEDHINVPAVYA